MQIGWIDFSEEDKNRTLTVLSSLSTPGSVDELGIGIVRDAMADRLFPATSTLLTKARYFFLVPYISRTLEEGHDADRQDPRRIANAYRDLERSCAEGLIACNEYSEGIIGRVALSSGRWVTRGPGEIYWASLRYLGFVRPEGPQSFSAQFAYIADARTRVQESTYAGKDDGLSDDAFASKSMWRVPNACYTVWKHDWRSWKKLASIDLTKAESRFLKTRIVDCSPNTLYALLLTDEPLRRIALGILDGKQDDRLPGDSLFHSFLHEGGLLRLEELSPVVAQTCKLADGFSELVYACRVAYNMQLFGLEDEGRREWDELSPNIPSMLSNVDLRSLGGELGLLEHRGYQMLESFLVRAMDCMATGDVERLKTEVAKREAAIKGSRRKIGRTDGASYAWRGGRQLPYRFDNAMAIVKEIDEAGGCGA